MMEQLALGVAGPPSSYAGLTTGLAVLMLVIEFGMLQATLLRAQVRLYAAQSVMISLLAIVVAWSRGVPELYGLAAFSVLLKVVAVPLVMLALLRRTNQEIVASRALGVASMVLLAVAVAIVLVSFVLMIFRRDVASQAIGFFALENGVALASLVVAATMPLILEVAFLFDLLVAVVVFAVLIRMHHRQSHHEQAQSLSTATLTELRG